jgi:hypothetical protein
VYGSGEDWGLDWVCKLSEIVLRMILVYNRIIDAWNILEEFPSIIFTIGVREVNLILEG